MEGKNSLALLLFMLFPIVAFSQSQQFRYRLYIQQKHIVKEEVKNQYGDTLKLEAGTILKQQRKYTIKDIEYNAELSDTLKKDTIIYTSKKIATPLSKLPGWATIAIDKDDKSKLHVNYWLGKNYKASSQYYIKLENRQYVNFWFNCIEGGALTIPFKYRSSFTKNGVEISDQFNADANIGMYLGYTVGKITYMYRRNEEKEPSKWLVSVGPFLSVSRVEIDSASSLSADKPLTQKRSIATISPGLGLMTSIYNFRIGVFLGGDIGVGDIAKKWDYNKKAWWGFGLGYNIGFIWGALK